MITLMSKNILNTAKKIHFIGIGGIGISSIARMMLLEGKKVSGSDRDKTKVTDELEKAGATIFISHDKKNIPIDCDLVIFTVAIPSDNSELAEAKKKGINMLTYPQTLNIISKEKYTIAVSGTHGKTTVTAMIAKVMIDAGLDPTIIVGSLLKQLDSAQSESFSSFNGVPNHSENILTGQEKSFVSNFIAGKSKYLVVEADEYKKSFHNLEPSILVINNIDADHLDFYKDVADIQDSFLHLAKKIPKDGFLICNTKLSNLQPIIKNVKCRIVDYGELDLKAKLLVPGEHNRQNAKTALALAQALNINLAKAETSVSQFSGTWRRFEYKGKTKSGAMVYDDYAHNPQKVRAALQGAREMFPDKNIIVVFQPHLFSRTKLLLNEFTTAFNDADEIILAPIFPAREPFDPSISSEILGEKISQQKKAQTQVLGSPPLLRNKCRPDHSPDQFSAGFQVRVSSNFLDIETYLKSSLGPNDVLITMGAGEQYKIGDNLLS